MKLIKPLRAGTEVIGSADINVIQAAYSLAKVQSGQAAREVLHDIPSSAYPALAKHMRQRPGLFLADVFDVVVGAIEVRKLSEAELLFV
jgi:hypothetical protein